MVTFMSFSACRATLFVCRSGCVGVRVRIIQCFGRSAGFGTPIVEQQAVFLQWHVSVSYCGVIPLNMESLEEAVVVLSFVLIPCNSLHCAPVFRRG